MGRPELFSYLSAFVSIVLAIALSNIIQSTNLLIQQRRVIRWDARPLVFAVIVALSVISEFFSVWYELALSYVSFWRLIALLCVPTLFALLAYSVLPSSIPPEGIDLARFYDDERRSWIVLFTLTAIADGLRGLERYYAAGRITEWVWGLLQNYALLVPPFAILYFARSRRWSWVGLVLLMAATLNGVSYWSIDVRPPAATSAN